MKVGILMSLKRRLWAGFHFAECGDLAVLRTATEPHKRCFSSAALVIWNSLLEHLHSSFISKGQFRRGLKPTSFSRPTTSKNLVFKIALNGTKLLVYHWIWPGPAPKPLHHQVTQHVHYVLTENNKLAPYGTDGRHLLNANFKVTWHQN